MACDMITGRQMVCKVVDISQVKQKAQQVGHIGTSTIGDRPQAAKNTNLATQRKLVESIMTRLKLYDREFQILQNLCHVRCQVQYKIGVKPTTLMMNNGSQT